MIDDQDSRQKNSSHTMERRSSLHPGKQAGGGTDGARMGGSCSVRIDPNGASSDGSARIVVTQADLESVASLYGRTAALRRDGSTGVSLDAHVRAVMRTMKERLRSVRDSPLQDVEVVIAKHDLYSICFRELITVTGETNPGLSYVLDILRDAYEKILHLVPGIVRHAIGGYVREVSHLREGRERDASEAVELVEAAHALEREAVAHHRELVGLRRRLRDLEEENASLKQIYTEGFSPASPPASHEEVSSTSNMRQTTKSLSLVGRPTSTLSDGRVGEEPTPEPSLERNREGYFTGVEGISVGGIRKRHTEGAGGAGGARGLSLKQLKDLISAVHTSKEKYDQRCAAQRLPSPTLARHLDDFLMHRHGLTSMARSQAAALRKGVENFRDKDNVVRVFEMTLRNEVDENFHLQQEHLEKTAVDLLRSRIQERVARRQLTSGNRSASIVDGGMRRGQTAFSAASSAASVDFLVRNQTRLGAPLAAADWQAVVDYVYKTTPADARTVAFLVKKAILMRRHKDRELRGTTRKGGREQEVRGSVPYGVFIQVLLEYQLHGHLRFLKLFKRDFREVDIDADGIVNSVQFLALATRTLRRAQRENPAPPHSSRNSRGYEAGRGRQDGIKEQATARLKVVDPLGFGGITFSACVRNLARAIAAGARMNFPPGDGNYL